MGGIRVNEGNIVICSYSELIQVLLHEGGLWHVRHKKLEELEDSFVGKYIKCIPTDRVNNWQSVDFIFDQRVYSIEEARIWRDIHQRLEGFL